MNRRGFLAGIGKICAAIPFVGSLSAQKHVAASESKLTKQEAEPDPSIWVYLPTTATHTPIHYRYYNWDCTTNTCSCGMQNCSFWDDPAEDIYSFEDGEPV